MSGYSKMPAYLGKVTLSADARQIIQLVKIIVVGPNTLIQIQQKNYAVFSF